ncbi:MAG: hypothetical protein ACFCUN_12610 [Hyphomicrobiaceae bacterium]
MTRKAYVIRNVIAAVILAGAVYGSFLALPAMATVLAPRGVNAGLIQNGIILTGGATALLVAWHAASLRLHAIGERRLWAAIAFLPPAILLMLDGPLFLKPLLAIPPAIWWMTMGGSLAVAIAVFLNCAIRPSVA